PFHQKPAESSLHRKVYPGGLLPFWHLPPPSVNSSHLPFLLHPGHHLAISAWLHLLPRSLAVLECMLPLSCPLLRSFLQLPGLYSSIHLLTAYQLFAPIILNSGLYGFFS